MVRAESTLCPYVDSAVHSIQTLFACPFLNKILTCSSNLKEKLLKSTKGNFQIKLIKVKNLLITFFW